MDLYEVKIEYSDYSGKNGRRKKVKETYLVEAFNLTDVDATMAKVFEEMPDYEDIRVTGAKIVSVNEIFERSDISYSSEPKWFKTKVVIGELDSEKTSKNVMFVRGTSIENAVSELKKFMADTIADWSSISVSETNVSEVVRKN